MRWNAVSPQQMLCHPLWKWWITVLKGVKVGKPKQLTGLHLMLKFVGWRLLKFCLNYGKDSRVAVGGCATCCLFESAIAKQKKKENTSVISVIAADSHAQYCKYWLCFKWPLLTLSTRAGTTQQTNQHWKHISICVSFFCPQNTERMYSSSKWDHFTLRFRAKWKPTRHKIQLGAKYNFWIYL